MKELSIEQKSKAYDEAIERAKNIYGASECKDILCTLETIFPELKESEDEKIKKAIISYIDYVGHRGGEWFGVKVDDIIAWLEKQGNQREQLINKACDILVNCIEDYMLRRMEVWSEECKNQTLENIRKKLEE